MMTRPGLPFKRYWTGTFDLPGQWRWNPDGDAPRGQAPCDGRLHILARVTVPEGLSGRIVNVQMALGADNAGVQTRLTGIFRVSRSARGVPEARFVQDQLAWEVDHPALGFAISDGARQNPFRVLDTPIVVNPGDVVEWGILGEAGPLDGLIREHCGPCTPNRSLPCCSGFCLYGFARDSDVFGQPLAAVVPLAAEVTTVPWEGPPRAIHGVQIVVETNAIGQQPLVFVRAEDGQAVGFFTVEDYAGTGGVIYYEVKYTPDWHVLPLGPVEIIANSGGLPGARGSCQVRLG